MIHLMGIRETFLDYPDNESLAVIVFTEGCSHGCRGCQNAEYQNQRKESAVSREAFLDMILERCRRNHTNKVVFSGGDPLYHSNGDDQLRDIIDVIDYLEGNGYSCCVYTGYDFEEVERIYRKYGNGRRTPLYFKCGRFVDSLRDKESGKTDDGMTLATTNQYFMKRVDEWSSPHTEWEYPVYERVSDTNRVLFSQGSGR